MTMSIWLSVRRKGVGVGGVKGVGVGGLENEEGDGVGDLGGPARVMVELRRTVLSAARWERLKAGIKGRSGLIYCFPPCVVMYLSPRS
jgi:hypothetical protein